MPNRETFVFQHSMGKVFFKNQLQVLTTPILPPKVYSMQKDPDIGFFLEESEGFTLPKKLYGNTAKRSARILKTFNSPEHQGKTLGVLLTGEKGSGKTLLAKKICIDSGLPVILINRPFSGDDFMAALQKIPQDTIIFWDEFEKTYSDTEDQEKILTLFDGVASGQHKLFLATANSTYKVADYFHDRPGRFYYAISFRGLDSAFIREYCEDNLKDPSRLSDILRVSASCGAFNFDMLQALVDDINRFGEPIEDVIEVLNVKPYGFAEEETWTISMSVIGDNTDNLKLTSRTTLSKNPMLHIAASDGEYRCSFFGEGLTGEGDHRREVTDTGSFYLELENLKEAGVDSYTFETDLKATSYWDPRVKVVCVRTTTRPKICWAF